MENKSFFGGLFDLSFKEFVTIRVIKVLYVLAIILAAIAAIGFIVSGFAAGGAEGVIMLVLSPLIFFLYVLAARVWLEIIVVIFRIADNTSTIVERTTPSPNQS
jgi:hypothetical protein